MTASTLSASLACLTMLCASSSRRMVSELIVPPGTTTASTVDTSRSPNVPSTSTFCVGLVSPSTAWIRSVLEE